MAYTKAWIVDHGPVRLHRNEPMDIVPPQPQSRVRRKVDQFRTLASRAASRIGNIKTRFGNEFKERRTKTGKPDSPLTNKRSFTAYGQEDIFINPFGSNITPERNLQGMGINADDDNDDADDDESEESIITNPHDTYQKLDENDMRPTVRDVAMNMMGIQRRHSGSGSDTSIYEYQREPETHFEASKVTTNYDALYYLARTNRSAMFTTMWRYHRDNHLQGDVLHEACRKGHTDLLMALIKHQADVNALDRQGTSALFYAVENGNTECATLLVENGAGSEVSQQLEPGLSVLHTAARKGNLPVIKALLKFDKWVDVNSKGEFDFTALHVAADSGYAEVITCLLDNGANVDALTMSDRTAFEIAMHNDKLDISKLLLERGSNIERLDGYGRSILHWAGGSASPHVVSFLLDNSASPRIANKSGMMPHHVAARHGRAANLHVLLSRGAPLNATYTSNNLPKMALHDALETKKYSCMAILLMHGAKMSVDDTSDVLLMMANTFAHEPGHFGGHLIEAFLYSGHVQNIRTAARAVFRKMALYADLEAWYKQLVPQPPSLRNICRVLVRRILITNSFGTSIVADIGKLHLPDALHDFVLLKESDLDGVLDSAEVTGLKI